MSTLKQTPVMEAPTAALKSGLAQKLQDEFYKPRQQAHFAYAPDGQWTSAASRKDILTASKSAINPKAIRLISWNIDMLVPFGKERMTAALAHLESVVSSTPSDTATVMFLQEMTPSDLDLITSARWIQTQFNVTDKDGSSWLSPHYGTTTLVDARLSIASVFRVPFLSKFDRDGLFVDITLSNSSSSSSSPTTTPSKILRLCNVHLESLVANPPVRPHQLSAAASFLHAPNVACALLAGDLNAIEPFDRTLHTDNKLQDAYLSLGGKEDNDEGYTWGYQVPAAMREKFGCSRMDKILFCGDLGVKAFERMGVDIRVAQEKCEEVRKAGEQEWVSDHYGVMGDLEVSGGWSLKTRDAESMAKPNLS